MSAERGTRGPEPWSGGAGGLSKHRADRRANGASDIERRGQARVRHLNFDWGFALQLQRTPADHRDTRRAYGVAFRDQASGSIDSAFALRRRFAFDPIPRALTRLGLADHLSPDRAHHAEAIVDLGDVYVLRPNSRHRVRRLHRAIGARGA